MLFTDTSTSKASTVTICHGLIIGMLVMVARTGAGGLDSLHFTHSLQYRSTSCDIDTQ